MRARSARFWLWFWQADCDCASGADAVRTQPEAPAAAMRHIKEHHQEES